MAGFDIRYKIAKYRATYLQVNKIYIETFDAQRHPILALYLLISLKQPGKWFQIHPPHILSVCHAKYNKLSIAQDQTWKFKLTAISGVSVDIHMKEIHTRVRVPHISHVNSFLGRQVPLFTPHFR